MNNGISRPRLQLPPVILCLVILLNLTAISVQGRSVNLNASLVVTYKGLNFSFTDFSFILLTLLILIYLISSITKRGLKEISTNPFLFLLAGYIFLSIVRGIPVYGKRAFGDARYFLDILLPIFMILSFKNINQIKKILNIVMLIGVFLCVIGYYSLFSGTRPFLADINQPYSMAFRVIGANGVLVILFVFFGLLIFLWNGQLKRRKNIVKLTLVLLGILIAISQHRSVWIAWGFGLLILLFFHPRKVIRSVFLVLFLGVLILPVLLYSPLNFELLYQSFSQSAVGIINPREDPTASWRIAGWLAQIEQIRNNPILGKGYGGYYSWFLRGHEITVSPHNGFVHILLKLGVLGLFLYIGVVISFFTRAVKLWRRLPPSFVKTALEVSIVTFAAAQGYLLGFSFDWSIWLSIGIGLAIIDKRFSKKIEAALPK